MDSAAKSASSTILTVVDAIGSSFWQLVSGPLTSVSANLHRWLVANASSTLIHVPGANDLVDLYINQPLGLQDMTTARFLSTFFVAYGVMALVSLLPAKMPRHLLCLVSGVVLNQFVFGINYAYILLTSMVAYTILAVGQYVKPLRGWAHVISGCAVFGYLCVRQITRSGVSASSVDDSILQMVLTIKLYSLGYNLFDGTADAENIKAGISSAKAKLAKEPADRSAKAQLSMLLDRQARGLGSLPSVIPFLGYVFNPATLFSGPAFEYKDYATAMERDSLPGEAPSRYLPALWKFVIGLVHLAAAALLKSEYSPEKYVYQPAIAVLSKDPSAPSFFTRLLYMYITFWVVRSQYYGCWKLAEGACVMGGFGYRAPQQVKPNVLFADTEWMIGESTLRSVFRLVFGASYETRLAQFGVRLSSPATGSAHTIGDWEGASNVALATVETRRGPDELVRSWNVFTQSWLERYIFKRAPRAGGFNRWLTFLASAFWHGFYSGYYLGFMTVPLAVDAIRGYWEAVTPLMSAVGLSWLAKPTRSVFYLVTCLVQMIVTQCCFCYVLAPFTLFDAHKGVAVWESVWYAGHVIPLLLLLVVNPLLRVLFPSQKEKGRTKTASDVGTSEVKEEKKQR